LLGPAFRISAAAALSAAIVSMPAHAAQRRSGYHAAASGSVWRVTPAAAPSQPRAPLKLSALPESPTAGQPVRLSVLNPASASAVYRWQLIGSIASPAQVSSEPQVTMQFAGTGIQRVGVTVTVGHVTQQATISILVRPQVAGPPKPVRRLADRAAHGRSTPLRPAVAHAVHKRSAPVRPVADHVSPRPAAHAAADPGVTIADFNFNAATVTIHTGETITWTNDGPSSHTATASNGSFNTGILKKGASASHTFTQPGTYSYICQIHPFMHGTVVVLAAAVTPTTSTPTTSTPAAPTGAPASGSSTPPATPTAPATAAVPQASGPTLPRTGLNVAAGALCGLLLVGLGVTLRRGVLSR
jgi:plastocyanin